MNKQHSNIPARSSEAAEDAHVSVSHRDGIRVLFINKTAPDKGGGMEQRLREMATRLSLEGSETLYLCARTEVGQKRQYIVDGISVRALKLVPKTILRYPKLGFYLPRILFTLLSFFTSALMIGEFRPRLIVDSVSPLPSAAIVVSKLFNIPVVLDYPEYFGHEGLSLMLGGFGFISASMQFLALKLAPDGLIALSSFAERRLKRDAPRVRNILMVPGGLKDLPQDQQQRGKERPTDILSVSRLVPPKRVEDLLRMLALLPDHENLGSLTIVGTGPLDAALKALAEEIGIGERCRFLGYVKESQKEALYEDAQLFVTASMREGFGISVLEAMSHGLPVVCYDIPPLNEVISEPNADLISGASRPEDLATCLAKVVADQALQTRLGEANRTKAEKFSYDFIAPAYLRFLLSVGKTQAQS